MPCKTYAEMMQDIKPYLKGESAEDIEAAVRATQESSYADLIDAYETNKVWAVGVLNKLNPTVGKSQIKIVDATPGVKGTKITYQYPSGRYGSTVLGDNIGISFRGADGIDYSGYEVMRLFSDFDFVNSGKAGYKQIAVDLLNDPAQMQQFAQELASMSTGISSEHKAHLVRSISHVTTDLKENLPKIAVHLNDQAAQTGGWVEYTPTNADIYLAVGPDNHRKSPLEVYAHELYHTVTSTAIDSNDATIANTRRQIEYIKNTLLKSYTAKDFAQFTNGNVKTAANILDYFANPKVGLHEFVAYAMTNEATISALRALKLTEEKEVHPDLASKLIAYVRELFNKVWEITTKAPKGDGFTQMQTLVNRLAQANNRQLEVKRNTAFERIFSSLVKFDDKVADAYKTWSQKMSEKPMPRLKSMGKLDVMNYLFKMSARALVDNNAKNALHLVGSSFLSVLKPERSVLTILRDMSESDTYQDLVEKFGLMSQNIDQYRDIEYTTVAKTLKDGFNRELTEDEQNDLATLVLDTDLQAIAAEIDLNQALSDEEYIKDKMEQVKSEIRAMVDPESYNFIMRQVEGLAYFMHTGKGHIAQYMNAFAIVTHGRDQYAPEVATLTGLVDRLASMEALRTLDVDTKDRLASLYSEQKAGVDLMVAYAATYQQKALNTTMSNESDKYKMLKGYSREVYDKDVNITYAPVANEVDMKKSGYKLIKVVGRHPMDRNPEKMGLYVSTINAVQGLHRVALRYEDTVNRGTTITEGYFRANNTIAKTAADRDISILHKRMLDIIDQQRKGYLGVTDADYGIMPLLDNLGNVKDFRYVMPKEEKVNLLKMDRRAVNVLGRMYATILGKDISVKFNQNLVDFIKNDAIINGVTKGVTVGRNDKEYIHLSETSGDKEAREIWKIVPDNIKRQNPEGLSVRRDMLHSVFGYRDLTVTDFPLVRDMPANVAYSLRVGEYMWKQLVKIAKTNIVIKIPAVLLNNILSNFSYSVGTWMSPVKVFKLQMEGVRELNTFLEKSRERIRLSRLIEAGQGTELMKRQVTALANDLENSAVRKLIDEGFYSTIVEDMDLAEFKTRTRVEKYIDDKLKHFPDIVQNGLHYLFVTDQTPIFKMMNMATQYSDFVARYAHYHLMMAKGANEADAIKTVRDVFINYNKPNSRFVEWTNQMGFVMFTKYFTRIQKAIKAEFKSHPIRATLEQIAHSAFLGGVVDDIFDQSLIKKNYGAMFHGPVENIVQALSPSGAEALYAAYKKL